MDTYCETCQRQFRQPEHYQQHLRNSPRHRHNHDAHDFRPADAGVRCVSCRDIFYSIHDLIRHQRSCTSQGTEFVCDHPDCLRGFTSQSSRLQHFETGRCPSQVDLQVVDNYFSLHCDPHGRFVRRSLITRNPPMPRFNRDRNRRYRCRQCPKRFRTQNQLMSHVWSPKHKNWGRRPYKCPSERCRRAEFYSLSNLMYHLENGGCEAHHRRELDARILDLVDIVALF
ncbi:hypothetical protein PGT21_033670 [Puccinia graminis f. sp. tritici]|uniref:C2H2-type domain-containing protein n=2 Tax=Puccinia graminis f. sp. tritici TaxID=56615 RepID=E3L529_PUCGT|nr:uncharacterized protein PGTG_17510 [Puccinia graminis f. sp. tritici CRL 75-36-700-3]EFP91654.2 hypothetical protein PGTG_17510 [Puccinia graminis f. sp. tritici CRL 75-36-700-3]KAA1113571.1 hypothetical protein PGT21_033670 [Puccinia graminis f. sp. tritici]